MRRFIVSLSLAIVVLFGLVASGIRTQAQDATPAAMTSMMATATHPVVGGWRLTVDLGAGMTSPDLQIFHADGTFTEVLPTGDVLVGV